MCPFYVGFSLGGFVAYCIASKLWDLPYFDAKSLVQNVTCIVFGSPMVTGLETSGIRYFQHIVKQTPSLQESYHCFLLKEDWVSYLIATLPTEYFEIMQILKVDTLNL